MGWSGPILDNHLHLDAERGRGLAAVDEFAAAGGSHLLVVNKPSWSYGVEVTEGADFREGFDATLEIVERATERLRGRAWAVLGVHPALLTRLVDDRGMDLDDARVLLCDGLDEAASYVERGRALALKSGRPHYPVSEDVWAASNTVCRHAFARAADAGCAIQLHTESASAFPEVMDWAADAGLAADDVVKHYASGPIDGPIASVISRSEALEAVLGAEEPIPFLMETDFLDDPDRPGAVLGPRTVPRRVSRLAEHGATAAIERAHVTTPAAVYGIDTPGTLSS